MQVGRPKGKAFLFKKKLYYKFFTWNWNPHRFYFFCLLTHETSELTLSLRYPGNLLPSRRQTHDPVPVDVTVHSGLPPK